jgi:hypothetical protein
MRMSFVSRFLIRVASCPFVVSTDFQSISHGLSSDFTVPVYNYEKRDMPDRYLLIISCAVHTHASGLACLGLETAT